MQPQNTDIQVRQPETLWQRPLKADFKGLFKAATKALVHLGTGKPVDMLSDVGEAVSSLGLTMEPGERAGLLVRRALALALYELVRENANWNLDAAKDFDDDALDNALEHEPLSLDSGFFERPAHLPFLTQLKLLFKAWLVGHGLVEARATTVVERLPDYFVEALHSEWRRHPDDYAPLLTAIKTPFATASDSVRAWNRYNAILQKQISESVFDETFSLSQIYIPLRACYKPQTKSKRGDEIAERNRPRTPEEKPVVVDLCEELDRWLMQSRKDDALRVISGGPGSGKSSFCKMYAAHVAAQNYCRVLFVPLHQFDMKNDLESAIGEFVRLADVLPANPLDPHKAESRLLLIFDGLDELAMQGKVGQESAGEFVRQLEKTLDRRNMQDCRVQAILSGRTLVVQSNAAELRKPGEVLELLPYCVPGNERQRYQDADMRLAVDQRQEWWRKYGLITSKDCIGLPPELARRDLDSVTQEPLLNYLVALSYGRGQRDFNDDINLNVIYADLLDAVYERAYAGRRHTTLMGMAQKDFGRVLEEIGLAVWHGDSRTTTVNAIVTHCENAKITRLLEKFSEGAETGVTRLLTAFYFRQYGDTPTGDKTFEFTHKSFGEYLTARRIVRGLERMYRERRNYEEDSDAGWNKKEALQHWAELCGPTSLDRYLLSYLRAEIALRDRAEIADWQQMLCQLFSVMLKQGMPMEMLRPRPDYQTETFQARNAEETLLAAIHACALVTTELSTIDWPHSASLRGWLCRVQPLDEYGNISACEFLGYQNLRECNLRVFTFYQADFTKSDLRNTDFSSATLDQADLSGADLSNACLIGTDLTLTDLRGTNLTGTNFYNADFHEADFAEDDPISPDENSPILTRANWWDADPESFFYERGEKVLAWLEEKYPQPEETRKIDIVEHQLALYNQVHDTKTDAV